MAQREHPAIHLLWETVRLLATPVSLIVTRDSLIYKSSFIVADVAERNEDAG